MKKLLVLRDIYKEAFQDWTQKHYERYFKAFSAFCFIMLIIGVNAFVFRLATGFNF